MSITLTAIYTRLPGTETWGMKLDDGMPLPRPGMVVQVKTKAGATKSETAGTIVDAERGVVTILGKDVAKAPAAQTAPKTAAAADAYTYTRLKDGTWGVKGKGLQPGQTVQVAKKDGSLKPEVVGAIEVQDDGYGRSTARLESRVVPDAKAAAATAAPATPSAAQQSDEYLDQYRCGYCGRAGFDCGCGAF